MNNLNTKKQLNKHLDKFEENFLVSKKRQRLIVRSYKNKKEVIDIGSAASIHLFEKVVGKIKISSNEVVQDMMFYPSITGNDKELEKSIARMIKKWTNVDIATEQVLIFNGIYGSYRTLLMSNPKKIIIVPESMHQIHKACFETLGKKVIEVKVKTDGLLDIASLEKTFKENKNNVCFMYLTHNRGPAFTKGYFEKIAKLLKTNKVYAIYDADVVYSSYSKNTKPWFPLAVKNFAKRSIFLGNLTKEFGTPGLRIGYGIAPAQFAEIVKQHKELVLEMIPTPNRKFAEMIIKKGNLYKAKKELNARMEKVVTSFKELGWNVKKPSFGVNLFIKTPPSFNQAKLYSPDELFCFYILEKTKVLFRPGSTYGDKYTDEARLVICQPVPVIAKIFQRLKKADINYQMKFPKGIEKDYERALG